MKEREREIESIEWNIKSVKVYFYTHFIVENVYGNSYFTLPSSYNNNILGFKDYLLEQNQLYWYVLWLGRTYLMREIPCSVVKRFF